MINTFFTSTKAYAPLMKIILLISSLFISMCAAAQDFQQIANSYLTANLGKHNLELNDVRALKVSSSSFSKSMDLYNVYVEQYHNGVAIKNTTSSLAIKNDKVVHAALSFQRNITGRARVSSPSLTPATAVIQAATALNLNNSSETQLLRQEEDNSFFYANESLSQLDIPVKMMYLPVENELVLCWEVGLYTPDGAHYYEAFIDALNGTLIKTTDLVISCNFDSNHETHGKPYEPLYSFQKEAAATVATTFMDNSQYRVFALPAESPNHINGTSTLVNSPANGTASPFGWHDIDGSVGPEFLITRGNNVFAQEDQDGLGSTFGAAPNGGLSLNFDIPQQLQAPAATNLPGATVNLFYMNNLMHDIWYLYGFDEQSGNFQQNNYGNGGLGNDFVIADAQDGSGFNNATFFPPTDGTNGRMNMFLWDGDPATAVNPLTVTNGSLSGSYTASEATFGNRLPNPSSPLTGTLVLVVDDNTGGASTDPNDACDSLTNSAAIAGNIAILFRGNCQFGNKVLTVQNAGAIAVIVVNNTNTAPTVMGPGDLGNQVTIPSIMVSQALGNAIIASLQAGNTINVALNNSGIINKDGSLDNGVVAHEYGHGISVRLTGGALNSSCLSNDEQMGEGWSDWFGMVITIEPGDTGADRRGIGTYVTNQSTTGRGIRNFPYSINRSINPVTYDSTNNTQFSRPHGVGSIWATMLWDLTWRFIDDYGFDPDVYNGTGGNNIVMQLIMDSLKLQPCSPGFIDGRDAILEADRLANNGVNRDRIWAVFAGRGLGLSATQGDSDNRFDQVEAFDIPAPLSINDVSLNTIALYPNPSTGIITVATKELLDNVNLKVIDLNGRVLLEHKEETMSITRLDLSFLSNGLYLLSVESSLGQQILKVVLDK
jgi:hypothetical protein